MTLRKSLALAAGLGLVLEVSMASADFSDLASTPLPGPSPTPVLPVVRPTPPPSVQGVAPLATPIPHVQEPRASSASSGSSTTKSVKPTPVSAPSRGRGQADLLSGNVFGEVTHDTTAPVDFQADTITGDRNSGLAMIGNVFIRQGDLSIKTARVDTKFAAGTSTPASVIASGKVYVRKVASKNPGDVIEAFSDEMEYQLETGRMVLRKNAKIIRGSSCRLEGDLLEYNLKSGAVGGTGVRGMCVPPAQ